MYMGIYGHREAKILLRAVVRGLYLDAHGTAVIANSKAYLYYLKFFNRNLLEDAE